MPEAAEVAVAAAQLGHVAVGRTLESVTISHPRTQRSLAPGALDAFVGGTVSSVSRHGKWLLIGCDHDGTSGPDRIAIHLRMSGQLLARATGGVPDDRHVHAQFCLGARSRRPSEPMGVPAPPTSAPGTTSDRCEIWFRDPRTFGEIRVVDVAPVAADLFDQAVTATVLFDAAQRRTVGVKAVLLDQTRTIAGIGSYLADEACHLAGIDPTRSACTLRVSAWERILAATRETVERSRTTGGVTLADEGWVDLWGRAGTYADALRVHARATCATCGHPTSTANVGGRRARWCRRCQDRRRIS